MRVLFIANHRGFSKFNAPYMQWFKNRGWVVDNASPGIEVGNVDNQYDVNIQRSPFSIKNINALIQLKRIISSNHYDIIHCHTPMGAVLGRLAAMFSCARKKNTKIIYTVHGFHFFMGAPIINWLVYYPIELILSKYTDAIVTINNEDYDFALKHKMAHGNIFKIDGVGCNLNKFRPLPIQEIFAVKDKLNIEDDKFIILYTAQFIKRKNQKLFIAQIPKLIQRIPSLLILFAGDGPMLKQMKEFAKSLNVDNHIRFLGNRNDIFELCGIAKIHVSTSKQEGLAINNIEAMACGCPLVISRIRGHSDICINGRNGFLFNLTCPNDMVNEIIYLYDNEVVRNNISQNNIKDVKKYSLDTILPIMGQIYIYVLNMN